LPKAPAAWRYWPRSTALHAKSNKDCQFLFIFLAVGFALVHAQVPPPEPTEPPSRLSMFAHDVSSWVDHIITDAKHIITDADHINTDADHINTDAGRINTDADHVSTGADHHQVTRSPPLPRPRPAELASAPVASKEKTPTPIQIND